MVDEFPFPFKPYKIQEEFMKELYQTIENRGIGIFESPTGTGKSLSIICSALKWLKDHQQRVEDELCEVQSDENEPDWVNEQFQQIQVQQLQSAKQATADKVARRQRRVLKSRKRFKVDKENTSPEEYEPHFSSSDDSSCSESDDQYCVKIFYCSRTHSQLSQFINEIKKSPYSSVRVTMLGSRGNLCINPAVSQLRSNNLINERCLELRQAKSRHAKQEDEAPSDQKTTKKGKCAFYSSQKVRDFSSHILSEIQDMENLVTGAKESESCPYYSTRTAVPQAEVVLLPYNMILHREQRKSLNVRLKDSVVIIDEAHNLIETINEIHSITINLADCQTTHRKLSVYLRKVKAKLKPVNLLHCKQVLHCINLLYNSFSKAHGALTSPKSYLFTIGDYQTMAGLGDINLFELVKYIRDSHLVQKVQGYEEEDGESSAGSVKIHTRSALGEISSLFTSLTNADSAGRILMMICDPSATAPSTACSFVRYISLNSEDPFLPLLTECRSVILAGGTMEPVGEVKQQLLNSCTSRDVTLFSCGHVIPPQNLLPLTLSHGKSVELNFSFENRKKPGVLQEVGNVLLEICQIVPGGIVCFFPSYQCLTDCKTALQKNGIIDKIAKLKTLFYDESGSKNTDGILESYSKRIASSAAGMKNSSNTGAVLFSVLGGKMSEGINFSDDLGRCVVVVGLPFANPTDPVLQEKMRYLDTTLRSSEEGRTPGQTYYENKCMKAVNQAIGRAVRHAEDYATILLLDKRYTTDRISKKLPAWIREHLTHTNSVDSANSLIRNFFSGR